VSSRGLRNEEERPHMACGLVKPLKGYLRFHREIRELVSRKCGWVDSG
jgi:hypothetical protein